jgi:Arm DNA-binding domain/Phage integrase, N-terminal SAM-like domain
LGLETGQPCSGGGGSATCGHLARDPGQREGGFGFVVAGSDQALEPGHVRIECRIAGLADRDGGVGVVPLGHLLVAQIVEQPGSVAGRLASDDGEAAPQQPVLGAPKQPGHSTEVAGYRVHQLKGAQVVVQLSMRRRDRLEVLDRGPVDPGRAPNRQREPIELIGTADVEDGLHGGGADQGRDLAHELPAGSHVEYVLLEPELNRVLVQDLAEPPGGPPATSRPIRRPRSKGVEPMTRDELLQLPPMITVPIAGRILGLRSRSAAYRAAARGGPSHHPHVRQAVRPHRTGAPEDRPPPHHRRRAQGGQLMRGAVYKRGSTWTWHFDIDPDPLTGRRRQRTKGGYQTKKAAEQALAEAIGQWRTGRLPQRSTHTLSHFLQEEWLPAVKPRLRLSTWANYRTYTAAYVVPTLGQVKLQALTPVQLNHLYAHLLQRGRRKTINRDQAGLAPKTVRNVHLMLHSALHDAMRWGYLVRNVAEAADPPAARSPEQRVWSPQELGAFLDHVRDDRLYALWLLVATTGMRRGELAGLRWVDIDFDHATVSPTIPASSSTTRSMPRHPRPSGAGAALPSTPSRSQRYTPSASARPRTAGPSEGATATTAMSSPGPTAARCILRTSPIGSSSTPGPPGCRGSACTTCATATPPRH